MFIKIVDFGGALLWQINNLVTQCLLPVSVLIKDRTSVCLPVMSRETALPTKEHSFIYQSFCPILSQIVVLFE